MITEKWIKMLIANDELWRFYKTTAWTRLRDEVLEENHYECYVCKQHGIINRHDIDKAGRRMLIHTVHHVQFVRNHPELALEKYYYENGKRHRNLIPVCKACHNKLHPEKRKKGNSENFSNEERW